MNNVNMKICEPVYINDIINICWLPWLFSLKIKVQPKDNAALDKRSVLV